MTTTRCPQKNGALACCYSRANAPFLLGHLVHLKFLQTRWISRVHVELYKRTRLIHLVCTKLYFVTIFFLFIILTINFLHLTFLTWSNSLFTSCTIPVSHRPTFWTNLLLIAAAPVQNDYQSRGEVHTITVSPSSSVQSQIAFYWVQLW